RDQLALVIGVIHFNVGQRRVTPDAPIDDALGAIDKVIVVHLLEDRLHRTRESVIHGEPLAAPGHAIAEAAHLVEDLPAGLLFPLPDALHELFAADVVPRHAF